MAIRSGREGGVVLAIVAALVPALVFACSDLLGIDDATHLPAATSNSARIGSPPEPVKPAEPPHACVETQTKTDSQHCGSCGHDCRGGACANGVCAPVKLVGALSPIRQLAASESTLAWTGYGSSNGVAICELPDCRTRRFIDLHMWGLSADVGVTSTDLFFVYQPSASASGLGSARPAPTALRCALPDCVASRPVGPAATVKIVDGELFTSTAEGLRTCKLPACADPKLVAPPGFEVLGHDGDDLVVTTFDFATNRSTVHRCASGVCAANAPVELELEGKTVGYGGGALVWADSGHVKWCRTSQCKTTTTALLEEREVFGSRINGESTGLLVSTDGTEAFVTERTVGIARVRLAGGKPTPMYSGYVTGVAVGKNDVYFFDQTQASIYRVAK